jgi:hypothetical protein
VIKLDIINQVVERTGISRTKAEMAVDSVFEAMKASNQGRQESGETLALARKSPSLRAKRFASSRAKICNPSNLFHPVQDSGLLIC